jgi:hypothetical protein
MKTEQFQAPEKEKYVAFKIIAYIYNHRKIVKGNRNK